MVKSLNKSPLLYYSVLLVVFFATSFFFFTPSVTTAQAPDCSFQRDLHVGVRGDDVTCLQEHLQSRGYFGTTPTGYFGPVTQEALSNWQRSRRITPASGYFGPISRSQYNQEASDSSNTSTQITTDTNTSTNTDLSNITTDGTRSALQGQIRSLQEQVVVLLNRLLDKKLSEAGLDRSQLPDITNNRNTTAEDNRSIAIDRKQDRDNAIYRPDRDEDDEDDEDEEPEVLSAPIQTAPSDGAADTDRQPTFRWVPVSGADHYIIHTSTYGDLVIDEEVEGTSYTLGNSLQSDEIYYWRVRAVQDGTKGEWSEVQEFSTAAEETDDTTNKEDTTEDEADNTNEDTTENEPEVLPAPTQQSPNDEASNTSLRPTFNWQSVSGADSYILHSNRINPGEMVINKQINGTSFTPDSDLDADTTHHWRIRAVQDGIEGDWSPIHEFTTGSETTDDTDDTTNEEDVTDDEDTADDTSNPNVTLKAPADMSTNQPTSIALEWEPISGVDSYLVHASEVGAMVIDEVVSGTSYTLDGGFDPRKTYYWRVQAEDDDPDNWSPIWEFTTESDSTSDDSSNDTTDDTTDDNSSDDDTTDDTSDDTSDYTPSDGEGSIQGDYEALMTLYRSTNGDNWDNNSGWGGDPSTMGSWYGVETNSNGRVISVKLNGTEGWEVDHERGEDGVLGGNGLTGILPPEIGDLKKVQYFNVKNNDMGGEVPEEIGGMRSLKHLYLNGRLFDINLSVANHPGKPPGGSGAADRSNNFVGKMPDSIGNLSDLEILVAEGSGRYDDGETGFIGPIPDSLNNLTNLKALYLNFNSLTQLPADISNLDEVTHFSVGNNNMNGAELPSTLSEMTSLKHIMMGEMGAATDGPGMTGSIPDLSKLKNLRRFWGAKNNLTGEFPVHLIDGTNPDITSVYLAHNELTGQLPEIGDDVDLTALTVNVNNMDGPIPESLWQERQLRLVGLGWNNFTGGMPQSGYPDYYHLKTLYMNSNNLSGSIPCEFWRKLENPTLGWLYIGGNDWSSVCESELTSLEGRGDINLHY